MDEKRARERRGWYLERFLERIGGGSPAPDGPQGGAGVFRVEGLGGAVRVRVVELLGPGGERQTRESVRAFRSSVVEAAAAEWRRDPDRPPVEVWVEFSAHEQTTAARDREELARRLCSAAESELPEPGGFARILSGRDGENARFPLVAPALTVARLPAYGGTIWHAVSVSGSKEVDEDLLASAVADAAGAAASPGTDGEDEEWLLLVAETFRHPSMDGIPEGISLDGVESHFERIWLFDPVSDDVRELAGG